MNYGFHPAAQAEHLEHVAYYESQLAGLGARYLGEVERLLGRICNGPDRFRVERAPDIRRAHLHQFPYEIIFRATESAVEVLAIGHYRRRPGYWMPRV